MYVGSRLKRAWKSGRRHLKSLPSSRTGENPPYGMIGGVEETSASFEARSAPRSYPTARRVNGSTRCAARMNVTMMKTPIANSTACRMWAPVSSRPNRIASAQPPANAAPNTSAPIKIAALITVTTLGQTIWRAKVGEGCELMGLYPVGGAQSLRKVLRYQAQKAQKNLIA